MWNIFSVHYRWYIPHHFFTLILFKDAFLGGIIHSLVLLISIFLFWGMNVVSQITWLFGQFNILFVAALCLYFQLKCHRTLLFLCVVCKLLLEIISSLKIYYCGHWYPRSLMYLIFTTCTQALFASKPVFKPYFFHVKLFKWQKWKHVHVKDEKCEKQISIYFICNIVLFSALLLSL